MRKTEGNTFLITFDPMYNCGKMFIFYIILQTKSFTYIPKRGIALGVENTDSAGWWFSFPGVCLVEDFVTEDEETEMVHTMDLDEWRLSQSGRRKQVRIYQRK